MELKQWLFVLAAMTDDWHGEPLGKIPDVQYMEAIVVPEEVDLRTCQEGAAQLCTLRQQLEVDVVPGKEIRKIAHCLGHKEEVDDGKETLWFEHEKTAKNLAAKKVQKLKADPAIASANGSIKGKKGYYRAEVKYFHHDDRPECCYFSFIDPTDKRLGKTKNVKRCLGHYEKKGVGDNYKTAKKEKSHRETVCASDPTIASFHVRIGEHGYKNKGDFRVTSKYKHQDDTLGCGHFIIDNVQIPYVEKDRWVGTDDEAFSLQNSPHCNLVKIVPITNSGSRVIDDVSVFRDAWERDLLFSCEDVHSPCADLRKKGGILVKKKCLAKDELERCTLWEKTYDFGKSASYVTYKPQYEDGVEPIYGLNGEFDDYKKHDKRSDFPEMMAGMAMMADMFSDTDPETTGTFNGQSFTCRCSFTGNSLFDCCKKGNVDNGECSEEEQELAKARDQGRCHFIGIAQSGSETKRVYCCFASKIARMLQEQSREQLGKGWGTPEAPDCRGLSIEDTAQTIDLSEAIDDFSVSIVQ